MKTIPIPPCAFIPLITFLLACQTISLAQDPLFSQFYNQRMLLNPALTGLDEGLALAGHYRSQWYKTAPQGFKTWNTCAECRVSDLGIGYGFAVQQDKEGAGILTTNSFDGAFSYTVPFGNNAAMHAGLSGGWAEKYLDFDRLIFSDQISAFTLQYDPKLTNLPPTLADRPGKTRFGSVGGGLAIRGNLPGFRETPINKIPFGSIGFSFQHVQALAIPEESLLNDPKVKLPMLITFHAGLSMYLPTSWIGSRVNYMTLNLLFRTIRQGPLGAVTAGAGITSDNWSINFLASRGKNLKPANANSFGISVGKEWKPEGTDSFYKLEAGYDFPTGHVGSQAGGILELSLKLRWKTLCNVKVKSKQKGGWFPIRKSPPCPKFNDAAYSRMH
jgi:type IX secretion system PorP/SprF family membrane protein